MIELLRWTPSYLERQARRFLRGESEPPSPSAPAPYRHALEAMGVDLTDIVLVIRHGGVRLAENLAGQHPSVTVHLLGARPVSAKRRAELPPNVIYTHCPDVKSRLRALSSKPQPQLIIERGLEQTGERVDTFRELFGIVAKGGQYVIDSVPDPEAPLEVQQEAQRMARQLAELAEHAKITHGEHTREIELGRSMGAVEAVSGGWIVTKRVSHQWKLRDREANRLLQARVGSGWGEAIASKPATTYTSRAFAVTHGEGPRVLRSEIDVPERWLRRYQGVTCYARKRVRLGDYWLPDTFRNPRKRQMYHRMLHSTSQTMARAAGEQDAPSRVIEGPYYCLDSEYYSHFGHVMTDVLGNIWGWQLAKELVPDLRPLLSLPDDQPTIPSFQRDILVSLDIDPDSIEYIRPGAGVRVEELYGCTSDWSMPHYAAPELADVWERIGTGCTRQQLAGAPELIFISRRPGETRTCLNGEVVEAFFSRLGFAIVYPEDLAFGDQIATFGGARVIAGFAGSGMFNMMFAPNATVLVLSGDSYTAINEYLIKSVVGGDIHYFWSPAVVRHPEGGWSWEAYRSNFVFDLDRFGTEIVDVVTDATT